MTGYWLLIGAILIAPIFWGGNTPLALLLLELLSLGLLASLIFQPAFLKQLSLPFRAGLLMMVFLPVVQLIPIPLSLWQQLPGYEVYAAAFDASGIPLDGARPLSLVPSMTEFSALALIPPLAVFLCAIGLETRRIRSLVYIFIGVATFQALLGLAQYGDGPDSVFRLAGVQTASATGTYVNRDHLAGLIEMALPISLALLAGMLGRTHGARQHARTLMLKLGGLVRRYFNQTLINGFVAIILMVGLIFTQSRTGVALMMIILLLSAIAFALRLGGRNVYGVLGSVGALSIVAALEVGLVPVLSRFTDSDPLKDARWSIYESTSRAIIEFFPAGGGVGAFNQVFLRFHPADIIGHFVNRAHNDYLEWVVEGGLIAVILIIGFLLIYFRRWLHLLRPGEWSSFHFVQVGAGIGMLALMLHGLIDFNLHIPANQIYFALIAAFFFHRPTEEVPPARHQVRVEEPGLRRIAEKVEPVTPPERVYPLHQGKNPFDD